VCYAVAWHPHRKHKVITLASRIRNGSATRPVRKGTRASLEDHPNGTRSPAEDPKRCALREDIHTYLLDLGSRGFTAGAIRESIGARFGPEWRPHENTIYSEIKRHRPPGDVWTLAADGFTHDERRLVLEMVAYLFYQRYPATYLTEREAWWIARIRSARPELELGAAYMAARNSLHREQRGEPPDPWEAAIANLTEEEVSLLSTRQGLRITFQPRRARG
jgi:hypothetical protein